MFQKMHVDEPENWQPVNEDQMRKELAPYYNNVGEVIEYLRINGKARTPWAFYRWTLGSAPSSMQDSSSNAPV